LGVHPDQIPEAIARNKRHGITGVSYARNGAAIIADGRADRELCRLEGVHHKNGGYGDDHAASPLDWTARDLGAGETSDAAVASVCGARDGKPASAPVKESVAP
jgi:hypothetical protein